MAHLAHQGKNGLGIQILSLEITFWIPKCLATRTETKERWPKTLDVIEKNELHVLKLLAKYWPSNWVWNNLSTQDKYFPSKNFHSRSYQNLWYGSYFLFIFPTILALPCNRIWHLLLNLSPKNDTPKNHFACAHRCYKIKLKAMPKGFEMGIIRPLPAKK